MIYNNTYFKEQLKKTYIEGSGGKLSLWFCVIAIALITIVCHNFFYVMRETIVADVFPHLVKNSFFGLISVYNMVIIVFFVAIFIIKYKRISLSEISTNKWYLMIKTGHSPIRLVFVKIGAHVISVACIYSLSFVLLIFIGSLLNLEMQINAIFSLALLGLVQVFFVVELIMSISVFIENRGNCLLLVIVGLVLMSLLAQGTGFDYVSQSIVKMEDTSYLFTGDTCWYIYVLLIATIVLLFVGVLKGWHMAKYYQPKVQLGEDVYSINYINDKAKYIKDNSAQKFNLFRLITKVALVFVVIVSIVANIGVIMLATINNPNSPKGNHIMILFESHTMAGTIEANDFVWFDKFDEDGELAVGDVVLFYDNNSIVVQMVESVNSDGSYLVDYVNYPNGVKEGSYSNTVESSEISGVLAGKSGWMGAFFVWNKTIVAKLLTTVLPTIILVFYDKIEHLIRLIRASAGTDEDDGYVPVNCVEYLVLDRDTSLGDVDGSGLSDDNLNAVAEPNDAKLYNRYDASGAFCGKIKYNKSFMAKLIQSPEIAKQYYNSIKNALLSIDGIKSNISWKYESFSVGRRQLAKLCVRGKTLCVYLALNGDVMSSGRYKLDRVDSKKFAKVPYLYKIRSNRRAKYCLELVAKLAEQYGIGCSETVNISLDMQYKYDTIENLIERKLIKIY